MFLKEVYYAHQGCNFFHKNISAVTQLIVINRIQNKGFVYILYGCVLCIFIMYIHSHTAYILKIFKFLYFVLYINIFNIKT